jgi:hypothetical protein
VHRELHVAEAAHRVRVGRHDDRHACLDCALELRPRKVEPVRQPVRFDRDACLECDFEGALEVELVGRPVVDDPSLRMAECAHRRMPHRFRHLPRQLVAPLALTRVEAELHPVELCEHVVREIERAVGADVDLRPTENAERRELLVHGGDLLALPA